MASGRFPGLDKRHGFFLSIENNQADRDNYHWKSLEEKEKKKQEVEDQVRSEKNERRRQKRERQKPDRQMYRPPHSRRHALPPCYRIEIEVAPNTYWQYDVTELGKGAELATKVAVQYHLDDILRESIEELLNEFEIKLKMAKN